MASTNKGFTLIELLIVIAIIGILAALVIIALTRVRQDAFNARIQNNVRQMRVLAESGYDSDGASYINWSQSPSVQSAVAAILNDTDDAHGNPLGAPYLMTIRESQQKDFCVSAPFHPAVGGYSCTDATGVFRTTTTECPDEPIDGDPLRCPSS